MVAKFPAGHYHFVAQVSGGISENDNVKVHKWVTAQELESMKDIAHGKWEIGVGKSYLEELDI